MIAKQIFDRILHSSQGSTGMQTLYPGYQYFTMPFEDGLGVVAYVDTKTAWIGASDPVVSAKNLLPLLEGFRQAAKRKKKSAAILPVSLSTAQVARSQNYFVVQIGDEPWYLTETDRKNPSAKALAGKGGKVESFDPHELPSEERNELEEILERWRSSRKMADLAFLNRVEPWLLFREKKYFRLVYHGKQVAFLAAVPVHARNAWYLVDLIRDPRAPAGTTELILQESSKLLREQGATALTLGMSPFAEPSAGERALHPFVYFVFNSFFHRAELFYGFKSLFQYKQKFNPDRWEPQYFISLDRGVSVFTLYGLARAIFPEGFIRTSASTFSRFLGRISLASAYRKFLNNKVVPCSPAEGLLAFLVASKVSLSVAVLSILYFFPRPMKIFTFEKRCPIVTRIPCNTCSTVILPLAA